MEKTYMEFLHLNNGNRDLETIIENYASTVLMMSIWLMSLKYNQLMIFLNAAFAEQISENYQVLIGLVTALSALNCVFCVIRIRYV